MQTAEAVTVMTFFDVMIAVWQMAVVASGVAVLLMLASAIVVVPIGFVAVIERLGRTSGVKRSGLRFKAPWPLERVQGRVPTGALQGGGDVTLRTRDGAPIRIGVEARVDIPVTEAARALSALGDTCENLDSLVREHIGRRLSDYTLLDVTEGRGRLALELAIDVGEQFKAYGLRIIDVVVGEPRTTVDVWRIVDALIQAQQRQDAPQVLPGPTPNTPVAGGGAMGVPDTYRKGCESDEFTSEDDVLRILTLMRAANPGVSEEALVSIVYKFMNERLVFRALEDIGDGAKN